MTGHQDVPPKLLAGGNRQIPEGEGDGPVKAYIAAMPGWKRELGARLDALIERTVPDVDEDLLVSWFEQASQLPGEHV